MKSPKLQTADQEERTYNASRGNKYALQAYVNTCTICTYASAARSEIAALEAPPETPPPATAARYQAVRMPDQSSTLKLASCGISVLTPT